MRALPDATTGRSSRVIPVPVRVQCSRIASATANASRTLGHTIAGRAGASFKHRPHRTPGQQIRAALERAVDHDGRGLCRGSLLHDATHWLVMLAMQLHARMENPTRSGRTEPSPTICETTAYYTATIPLRPLVKLGRTRRAHRRPFYLLLASNTFSLDYRVFSIRSVP